MKKIISILSHCDTEEKKNILIQTIDILREKTDFKIILNSHISLPENIINRVDYFLYDRSNPVMDMEKRSMLIWKVVRVNDTNFKLISIRRDYGWTPFNKIKNTLSFVSNMDLDEITFLNYDLKITNELIEDIKKIEDNVFYNVVSGNDYFNPGLLIFNISKQSINTFINELSIKNYLKHNIAEDYLRSIINKLDYLISGNIVNDRIRIDNEDLFNNIENNDFKVFIGEDKSIIYDIENEVTVSINGKKIELKKGVNYTFEKIYDIKLIENEIYTEVKINKNNKQEIKII